MTKSYKQMHVLDAFSSAARNYPGGLAKLAERIKKSEAILRNKIDRDVTTHVLGLEEALQIIELLDVTVPSSADQIVKVIMWRLRRMAFRHDGVDSATVTFGQLIMALLDAFCELGSHARDTIGDQAGVITINSNEADVLLNDISGCAELLMQMDDYIDHHRADNRPRLVSPAPQIAAKADDRSDVQ